MKSERGSDTGEVREKDVREKTVARDLTPPSPLTVDSRVHIYVVVNPGFESVVEAELRNLLSHDELAIKSLVLGKGGIELCVRLGDVIIFQPRLKSATRVLLRVAEFVAKDFPKLYKKTEELPWHAWIRPETEIEWRAVSHQSRLRIKKRVESVTGDAVKARRLLAQGRRENRDTRDGLKVLTGFIRVHDNLVTLSLDLSGDLLHKRGERVDVGTAPLRETWASAIVSKALALIPEDSQNKWIWIEPMAGTAVFAREYLRDFDLKGSGSKEPRIFALEEHYKVGGLKRELERMESLKSNLPQTRFSHFVISDRDVEQLKRASEGLQDYQVLQRELGIQIDVLRECPETIASSASLRFLVINPPWGVRLKEGAVNSIAKQEALLREIEATYRPNVVACVFPQVALNADSKNKILNLPRGWAQVGELPFKSGGIPVRALFFKRH